MDDDFIGWICGARFSTLVDVLPSNSGVNDMKCEYDNDIIDRRRDI